MPYVSVLTLSGGPTNGNDPQKELENRKFRVNNVLTNALLCSHLVDSFGINVMHHNGFERNLLPKGK